MCIEREMPAITNISQKESDMLWDYFAEHQLFLALHSWLWI